MLYNHNLKNFPFSSVELPRLNSIVFYLKLYADLLDSSPNGYNATNIGGVSFAAGQGRNGEAAADFNGVSQWLGVPDHTSNMTGHKATFNAWVKLRNDPPAFGKTGLIYSGNEGNPGYYPRFGGDIYDTFACSPRKLIGNIGVNKALLHMLTITVDEAADEYKMYQNGAVIYQTTAGTWNYDTTFLIGQSGKVSIDKFLDGYLSDVSVWNVALTAAEIATLYNGGIGLTY